jgi:hypothetical protein
LDFDSAAVPEPTHHDQDDRDDLGDAEDPVDRADPGSLRDLERESGGDPDDYLIGPHTLAFPNQYDEDEVQSTYRRDDMTIAQEYIKLIRNARLGDQYDKLEATRERLANPPEELVSLEDLDLRFSLGLYMAMQNASEDTYTNVRRNILHRYPDSGVLSLDQVKRRMAEITGVTAIIHDVCINSCMGYTGPWADLDECPLCKEPRWDPLKSKPNKKVPRQQFTTIPLGPQLQALWRTPEGAESMKYRRQRTADVLAEIEANDGNILAYDDVLCGSNYLNRVVSGEIKSDDIVLIFSMDGARLYRKKESNCWIYIWVVVDHAPQNRYKKHYVLPGGVFPGPNPPKNSDSLLFPGLHHLSALQNQGLRIWDAQSNRTFVSKPFFFLGCADFVGMPYITGLVGHRGKNGFRVYCNMAGRLQGTHYYPARLKPLREPGSDRPQADPPDVSIESICTSAKSVTRYREKLKYLKKSRGKTQFTNRRTETGISRPSILSALPATLPVPSCVSLDIMHLEDTNLPETLIELFRGIFDCKRGDSKQTWDWAVLKDEV